MDDAPKDLLENPHQRKSMACPFGSKFIVVCLNGIFWSTKERIIGCLSFEGHISKKKDYCLKKWNDSLLSKSPKQL
jgi:hypothetical protein